MFGFARRLIATTAIAAAMLAGAMPAEAQNKVINVATVGEPPTLDPVGVTADLVSIITQHIFETLYTFDGTWKVVPLLASGPATISADGLTYTIPLRQGVQFHNGKP
ncbi:MAG: hypothetical protein KAY22_23880, partial [Rhizorhabdus sp.]|uniref:ABC transporter substrate-binding protein n=1 Tax=Rhizorhabdus sp. TaxID=1968843 RepID=UPI001B70346E